ncbi:MAG: LTA synthase family protein [Ruminococcaceae bacterium]|nr:LTA synthase family protein [Oscillospiraceae bacterium]
MNNKNKNSSKELNDIDGDIILDNVEDNDCHGVSSSCEENKDNTIPAEASGNIPDASVTDVTSKGTLFDILIKIRDYIIKIPRKIRQELRDPTKPHWYTRSPKERLVTMIPGLIMLIVVVIAWIQAKDVIVYDDSYNTELRLSLGISAAALLIGVFCIRLGKFFGWLVTAATPAAVFLLTEYFTHNPFEMTKPIVITNLIFYYGTAILVLFLTGSMKVSIVTTAGIPMIFGLVNYYTLEFRGSPLFPWDIASAGVAADVVDNYTIIISWHVCFLICAFLFIIMLGFICTPRIKISLWWLRAPISVFAAVALVMTGSFVQVNGIKELKMYPYLFSPKQVFKKNGAAVTYAYTLQFTGVQKPDGYSPEKLDSLLSEHDGETLTEDSKRPNVIVIMNEAFSDLKTMVDYEQNKPVTPYIDGMTEDTVKGTLHVSVKGGNTANSEFEFLTGISMANLTPGSIPYQQYLTGDTPTFATQLEELGYTTVGMHPYGATGWNRDDVYEWFGFDETYFSDSFSGFEKIRNYYSDAATYRKIIDLYENKDEGKPLFVFDVTMQNHGGYSSQFENFTPELYVSGIASQSPINMYLSLINKSDEAFGELVEYFKAQDEPTVILMFGDHQPHDSYVKALLTKYGVTIEPGSLDEQLRRYTVPFVMWANYDIEEETGVESSINYMSSILCEKAGIPRSSTQMYLTSLYEKYPVVCEGHYGTADGKFHDATTLTDIPELMDYRMLSYNMIADRDNTLEKIYSYGK